MARRLPPSLNRRGVQNDPVVWFYIYCEGENTEPTYFRALQSLFPGAKIKINPKGPSGAAFTCAQTAVKARKALDKFQEDEENNSFEEMDQVWAVFDRDQTDRYDEAVALCERAKVGVGRSNPCFEVFLILHCDEKTFDRACDTRSAERHLNKIHPAYDPRRKKIPDCGLLLGNLEQAEARADDLLKRRVEEGNPFGAPSTTVHHLTRAIRAAAERSRPGASIP